MNTPRAAASYEKTAADEKYRLGISDRPGMPVENMWRSDMKNKKLMSKPKMLVRSAVLGGAWHCTHVG
jgi:hypothetical protein